MEPAPFGVFLLTADEALASRWKPHLSPKPWSLRIVERLTDLPSELGRLRQAIVLMDARALRPVTERVSSLKKQFPHASLVLVSGSELSDAEVIGALQAGADDSWSVAKDPRVIAAHLAAHLRRLLPSMASVLDVLTDPAGRVKADRSSRTAWSASVSALGGRGGWTRIGGLTANEFHLLCLFLEQPGKILNRQSLIDSLTGSPASINPGSIDKYVQTLRTKLGPVGQCIRTVYGEGYVWDEAAFKPGNPPPREEGRVRGDRAKGRSG